MDGTLDGMSVGGVKEVERAEVHVEVTEHQDNGDRNVTGHVLAYSPQVDGRLVRHGIN